MLSDHRATEHDFNLPSFKSLLSTAATLIQIVLSQVVDELLFNQPHLAVRRVIILKPSDHAFKGYMKRLTALNIVPGLFREWQSGCCMSIRVGIVWPAHGIAWCFGVSPCELGSASPNVHSGRMHLTTVGSQPVGPACRAGLRGLPRPERRDLH